MKMEKIGCFFIYSLLLIILGMGLYKYRTEVIEFLGEKYEQAIQYIKEKAPDKIDDIKNTVKNTIEEK